MRTSPFSFLLILLLVLPGLSGCELFRKIGDKKNPEEASYKVAKDIANHPLVFDQIAISGKADIRTPDLNLGASYRIHIKKDEKILIRISKIIEVIKVLITTDSIFVQDKINQAYYACDYSLAKEYLGVEANFKMIQAMFLGDYYPLPPIMKLASPPQSNPLKFSGMLQESMIDYYLDKELRKLVRLSVENPQLEGTSNAYYEDFDKVNGQNFPMTFRLEVPAPMDGSLSFNHRRVQPDPANLNFEFDIPANYSRQDCPEAK